MRLFMASKEISFECSELLSEEGTNLCPPIYQGLLKDAFMDVMAVPILTETNSSILDN